MNMHQLNPWNWFRDDVSQSASNHIPIKKSADKTVANSDVFWGNPWVDLHRQIDRLFDGMMTRSQFPSLDYGLAQSFTPSLDVAVEDDKYSVSVEMPGMDERNVNIELSGNLLTIRGEKKEEKEDKDKHYYRVERRYGSFQRSLNLPDDVDLEKIQATMNKGVLQLQLPRDSQRRPSARKIEVVNAN